MAEASVKRVPTQQRDRILIQETAALLTADLSLHDVFESLCELLARFIDASVVFVGLRHDDGSVHVEYLHDHGEIRRRPNITAKSYSHWV